MISMISPQVTKLCDLASDRDCDICVLDRKGKVLSQL